MAIAGRGRSVPTAFTYVSRLWTNEASKALSTDWFWPQLATITGSGGLSFAGASSVAYGVEFTITGANGITFGGTADSLRGFVYSPNGGLLFDGSASMEGNNVPPPANSRIPWYRLGLGLGA